MLAPYRVLDLTGERGLPCGQLHGATTVEGSRFVLSRTPAAVDGPAPSYGADNDYVLREILGYDDERVTALVAAGALV